MGEENKNSTGIGSEKDPIGKVTGFFLFRNLLNSYNSDKQSDDDSRKNIKKYGVVALILSIIALLISVSCLFSSVIGLDIIGFSYVLMMVIYILGGVIISILLAIYGFILSVLQIRLNRKAVGIFALILSVLSIVASVLLVIFIII